MGFADGYLQKHAIRQCLVTDDPDPDLNIIVTIPCHNESGLLNSLDSLFKCETEQFRRDSIKVEVLIFINAAENASEEILQQNLITYNQVNFWIESHPHSDIKFYQLIDNQLQSKHAGVGLARKIVMDEAVSRFNLLNKPDGIILSLDADAYVDEDYLTNIYTHFCSVPYIDGCAIYFEHPVFGSEFSEKVYKAIIQYELHQRYYVRATEITGYPYAFHTVGSCFGIRASAYCKQGGMNKRQGGEDFYFIQKVAQNGRFNNCITTRVVPSPRPSDRVPFGTGPAIIKLLSNPDQPLKTYNPELFYILANFFRSMKKVFENPDFSLVESELHSTLKDFLMETNFIEALNEIRSNSASSDSFMKRFWRYFNMFHILKYLHFARDKGFNDIPVDIAAGSFLKRIGISGTTAIEPIDLLIKYRELDRESISYPPL